MMGENIYATERKTHQFQLSRSDCDFTNWTCGDYQSTICLTI